MVKSVKKASRFLRYKIATNLVLASLILSVGALCLSPTEGEVSAGSENTLLYRSAGEGGTGVSLTFNVYEGTEEVYRILEILQASGAKATFFIGGCWADDNVECLQDIFKAGHEIGNHGYFHKNHAKLSKEKNREEILSCNQFIKLSIGVEPTLFAPPSGAYGEDMLSVCQSMQMKTILWSKDTLDWRDKNAKVIYTRATTNVVRGDFILMHPTQATVNALPEILNYYEKTGFKTVTVSENLREE